MSKAIAILHSADLDYCSRMLGFGVYFVRMEIVLAMLEFVVVCGADILDAGNAAAEEVPASGEPGVVSLFSYIVCREKLTHLQS